MSRRARWTAAGAGLLVLAGPGGLRAQGPQPLDSAGLAFVEAAREAASRYRDVAAARLNGYRRIGPDFPGMGEHWINLSAAVSGALDPAVPAILSYAARNGGAPVLLGVAYAVPLGPGEEPPAGPLDPGVWHDHSRTVDEELLLISHPTSMDRAGSKGHRVAVVHVWTELPNRDGVLAQHNWSLPYWRAGIPPPVRAHVRAARGVSLAHGGRAFYRDLLRDAAELSPAEREAVDKAVDRAAAAAEDAIERHRAAGPDAASDPVEFERIWEAFWGDIRAGVSAAAWARLVELSDPRER
ncbi:MAG TPA: hypothetical protein VK837_02450 [Longimicrobiales bacterium]|nr:hypothetical protein [Longimicrobiales bacterium]